MAAGSRGDVLPCIAFALRLKAEDGIASVIARVVLVVDDI